MMGTRVSLHQHGHVSRFVKMCWLMFQAIPITTLAFPSARYARGFSRAHPIVCQRHRSQSVVIPYPRSLRTSYGTAADGQEYDAEDPWEQALDKVEARRRRAAEEAELASALDSSNAGWYGDITSPNTVLLQSERKRQDETSDRLFYDSPRLVYHADNDVFARLTAIYKELLTPGDSAKVLDLGASWVSHLPDDLVFAHVEGLGLNAAELKSNPRLDSWRVQDLNSDSDMQLPETSYDAILICFALQYFVFPEMILSQAARALKDDGVIIISWGSGCYSSKSIKGWLDRDQEGRVGLVLRLLVAAGFDSPRVHTERRYNPLWKGADELMVVSATLSPAAMQATRTAPSFEQKGSDQVSQSGPDVRPSCLDLGADSPVVWEERLQNLMEEAQSMVSLCCAALSPCARVPPQRAQC